jgi:pilus assembly protein FimV
MRAKPIFRYSLLAGVLALPGHALALGLGKLTVESALGQPLSARIELTSVAREDLDSLRARIADPGLYRQNNLTYQGTLSRARISLEGGNSAPYLRVTSPVSVQEPFLDLLVELDWASGRVVREYTFLLDPPGLPAAAATEPVTPARAGTPARTAAAPAQRAPASSSSAAGASSSGGSATTPSGGGDQYAVKRGDTLQRIATQYKPADVTLEQMLAALFRGNQGAFEGDNMNRLRAGSIVTIPSAQDAQATPAAEASRIVRVQASDWRNYRDPRGRFCARVDGCVRAPVEWVHRRRGRGPHARGCTRIGQGSRVARSGRRQGRKCRGCNCRCGAAQGRANEDRGAGKDPCRYAAQA